MPFLATVCELLEMRCPGLSLPIIALWVQRAAAIRTNTGTFDAQLCNNGSYTSPDNDWTYVPNAWNAVGQGFSCITVRNTPPSLNATWKWWSDPDTVHSYPHVKFTDPALPVPLSNISALTLSVQWAMAPGSTPRSVPSIDSSGLSQLNVSANAAFDIFADRNPLNSQKETEAETEIMIWLGRVGNAQPLGYTCNATCCAKVTAGGVEFTLYQGTNQRGTVVFTWVADSNQTAFAADISPLLQYLWRTTLVSGDSYLGFIGFGTETYHTNKNVTFSLSNYHINVSVGAAPTLPGGDPPDACSPPADAGRRFGPWRLGASISGMVAALLVFL